MSEVEKEETEEEGFPDLLGLVEVLFHGAHFLLQVPQFSSRFILGPHCIVGTQVGFFQLGLKHNITHPSLSTQHCDHAIEPTQPDEMYVQCSVSTQALKIT